MAPLGERGDLGVAEVAFYSPALILAIGVVIKHGFARNLGWFYLATLCVLRIIGSATTLYMEQNNDYSSGLVETAAITNAVGAAPLLLALMGLVQRVNKNMMAGKGLSPIFFQPVHLVAILGLVLGIVGGVFESEMDDPDKNQTGKDCMEAASVIFAIVYLVLAAITLFTATRMSHVPSTEKKLEIAAVLALPFLLVRMAYTLAIGFGSPGSNFYFKSPNVLCSAFMMFLMEAIVLVLFIGAGFLTPKESKTAYSSPSLKNSSGQPVEYISDSSGRQQEMGYAPPNRAPMPQQQQRSLGDYRPSRMIRNAMSGR